MNKSISALILLTTTLLCTCPCFSGHMYGQNIKTKSSIPCMVADKETAVKVAEVLWLPLFGEGIFNHKPFVARLVNDDYWEVVGTLHTDSGGVPFIRIRKKDCAVMEVYHSK